MAAGTGCTLVFSRPAGLFIVGTGVAEKVEHIVFETELRAASATS